MQFLELVVFLLAGVWQGIRQDFNLLEIALLAMLIAWRAPEFAPLIRFERFLEWASRRRALACLGIGAAAIGIRLALLPLLPAPLPFITDEFSYLLLADTFLTGRLVNPTHPFWVHFESMHILQQPHYVSIYFPGQAVVLAAATWMVGQPWIGVVMLSGIFCGVLCWCLQGWMPARWALFGAIMAMLRFSIGSYWINAFHGGFLAATAGALIVGAYIRLRRRPGIGVGCVFALGLSVMAICRPMEGSLFSLPFVLTLPFWRWRILVPITAIVGLTLVSLGYYFYRVTGSPFKTGYNVNLETYGSPMALAWGERKPMHHRHVEMARYYQWEIAENSHVDSPFHFLEYLTFRVQEYWRFFLGPALSVPLIAIPWVWRRRHLRVVFAGLGAVSLAILLEGAPSPHYLAPATAVMFLLLVECFRQMWITPRGRALARWLPVMMVLVLALRISAENLHLPYTQKLNWQSWCCRIPGDPNKDRVARWLEAQGGKHLVFVREKSDDGNVFQWIYNSADIDNSRIIWARDLGDVENRRLAEYSKGRRVWMLNPNVQPASIAPYLDSQNLVKAFPQAAPTPN